MAALFLQQASLHVGPLRASQPFLVIVDPMVSIAIGVQRVTRRRGGGIVMAAPERSRWIWDTPAQEQ